MGLIQVAKESFNTMISDQYLEYFYCDAMEDDVLMTKGKRRNAKNNNGTDNIISNGSIIVVNAGQCMIIVDQGQVVEVCTEPGPYKYDRSSEPSIFCGNFGKNILNSFKTFGKRVAFAGDTGNDQRVYYVNTREIRMNVFGTQNPIPFRVVDKNIGLDIDIAIRCNGKYSFKISDPILFYNNVATNVSSEFNRSEILSDMKAELLSALQPGFAKISAMGIRYSEVPNHTNELARVLNEELAPLWSEKRGIEIVTMSINSITAPKEDEEMIKDLQKQAVYRNKDMLIANMGLAQAEAMKLAAANESTGPMMAFAGMNMASMTGGNAMNPLLQMSAQEQAMAQQQQMMQQQQMAPNMMGGMNGGMMAGGAMGGMNGGAQAPVLGWTCSCGQTDNRGKFCMNCGGQKPSEAGWTCGCGTVNQGRFCMNCGSKKPEGAPLYKCDKCGWEPEDPANPPKFCPECGDTFDENDRR
ncbi:MAG: SPFH domain-containing protein [Lachnospiraceae bacterium]|nr:SPFH domain-containing protein [Lachnospiraceae bacterium]